MRKLVELEQKWLNYKVKSILVPMVKISGVYLVGVSAYYAYDQRDNLFFSATPTTHMTKVLGVSLESNSSSMENSTIELKEEPPREKELTKELQIEEKPLEKVTFTPVIPVIDMAREERIKVVKRRVTKKNISKKRVTKKRVNKKQTSHLVKAKPNSYLTPKELGVMGKGTQKEVAKHVAPKEVHKTKKMHFTTTSVNYVEKIKSKFARSNNARDALLLAKLYYKKKNFQEAEEWALSANKLNNSLEESWLLFAKSKVKLGKKQEALKILVAYYKKNRSAKVKQVINHIKQGKL